VALLPKAAQKKKRDGDGEQEQPGEGENFVSRLKKSASESFQNHQSSCRHHENQTNFPQTFPQQKIPPQSLIEIPSVFPNIFPIHPQTKLTRNTND
jgi:hypothetical protein